MSISATLANANSGLAAASKRASLVSSNVSNALTPGYSKRSVNVSEARVGGSGAGVTVNGITRSTDPALTNQRRIADSSFSHDQAVANAHAKLNTAIGEPGEPFGIFAQFEQLESGLRSLAQTPESQPLQEQVIDSARFLVASLHDLTTQAQAIRSSADQKIDKEVDFVNATLDQIAKLNGNISDASAGGRDATALQDQRQLLIDEVTKIIPVREVPRGNGKIDLITNGGVFLLAGTPRTIEFTPANVVTHNQSLAAGSLSRLTVEGVDITPGSSASFSLQDGSLAGHFKVRDEVGPEFQIKIDALARDLIERFENIDPSLTPGEPGLFTDAGSAFDPTAESGLAGRIAVNALADPDQGGQVWRIRDGLGAATQGPTGESGLIESLLDSLTQARTPPPGSGVNGAASAVEILANISSSVGAARISAETRLAATNARAQSLSDAEKLAVAVDVDQELQDLLVIEQAFSANARVIQVASQMIQQLLEL